MTNDFEQSLKKMLEIHNSKAQDYADPNNRFSNFDVQEYISKLFKNDRDKVFATMVSVKLARLSTLLGSDRKPNNESIEDTFIDLANYVLIWKADYVNRLPPFQTAEAHAVYKPPTCEFCNESEYHNSGCPLAAGRQKMRVT